MTTATGSRRLRIAGALVVATTLVGAAAWASACASLGGTPEGERLARMQASPQWQGERFGNTLPRVDGPASEMMSAWFFGGSDHASPDTPIPVVARRRADFDAPPASGLRVTWLGHSTLIVELDGHRVLVDPVWGERASPFSWAGPKRWYAPPLPLDQLPKIDAVVISHDHYDHLDAPTVRALASANIVWAVPLGVGAHLEAFGVPSKDVVELDWWGATQVGALTLTATPARHFSGRWLDDADRTLWSGWAIVGPTKRVFYSGDTALFDGFTEVGEKLGPFDVAMLEVGAYNRLWADVHLGPEQALQAFTMVKGQVFLPVHWGLFDLALHGWTEPIERVMVEAERRGVRTLAPRPGEMIEPATSTTTRWWPAVPWQTVAEAPAWSTGVPHLQP